MSDRWVGDGDSERPVRRRNVGDSSSGTVLALSVALVPVAAVLFARLMGWLSPASSPGGRMVIVAGAVGLGFVVVVVWFICIRVSEGRPNRQLGDGYSLVDERARLEELAGKRVDAGALGSGLAASLTVWAAGGPDGSQVAAVNRWLVMSSARLDFEAVLIDVVAGRRLLEVPLFYEHSQLGTVRREAQLEPRVD